MKNKRIVIYPEPGEGISCGKAEIVLNDHNIKCIQITHIIGLCMQLRKDISHEELEAMTADKREKLITELELTKRALLN